jgi:hypothetical protein
MDRAPLFCIFYSLAMMFFYNHFQNSPAICYSFPDESLYSESIMYDNGTQWKIVVMRHDNLISMCATALVGTYYCEQTLKTPVQEFLPLQEPHFPITAMYASCRDCTIDGYKNFRVYQPLNTRSGNLSHFRFNLTQFYAPCYKGCS